MLKRVTGEKTKTQSLPWTASFQVLSSTMSVLPLLLSFRQSVPFCIMSAPISKLYEILYWQTTIGRGKSWSFPLPSVQVVIQWARLPIKEICSDLPDSGLRGPHSTLNPSDYPFMTSFHFKSPLDFPKPWFCMSHTPKKMLRILKLPTLLLNPGFPQSYPGSCYYK